MAFSKLKQCLLLAVVSVVPRFSAITWPCKIIVAVAVATRAFAVFKGCAIAASAVQLIDRCACVLALLAYTLQTIVQVCTNTNIVALTKSTLIAH
jgi:hypothetical protein